MKLFTVAAALSFATPVFLQETYPLVYDTSYDNNLNPLTNVACSTGEYGLITYGYNIFGQLPTYPYIGGAPQIMGYNSPECGCCWNLMYTDPHGVSTSLNFTAINTGPNGGFDISLAGMSYLTNGNAGTLDGVSITATQLSASVCNLY